MKDKKLSATRQAIYDLLHTLTHAEGAKPPALPPALRQLLDGQAIHGLCWVRTDVLVKQSQGARPLHRSSVQRALRALEERGVILPYGTGPKRSVAYVIFDFDKPVPAAVRATAWTLADAEFVKRMDRVRQLLQQVDPMAGIPS
jgi:hypothetical protein